MIINVNPYGRFEDVRRVMDFSLTANAVKLRAQKAKVATRNGQPTPRPPVQPPTPEPEPETAPMFDADEEEAEQEDDEEDTGAWAGSSTTVDPRGLGTVAFFGNTVMAGTGPAAAMVTGTGAGSGSGDGDIDGWNGDPAMLVLRVRRLRQEVGSDAPARDARRGRSLLQIPRLCFLIVHRRSSSRTSASGPRTTYVSLQALRSWGTQRLTRRQARVRKPHLA